MQSKACLKCNQEKTLDDFHRLRHGRMGRHSWCKECFNSNARATRKTTVTATQRQKWNLSRRYGLTQQQKDEMLARQNSLCAICSKQMKRVCVDHCHTTGKVRGLLCHGCNIKLPAVENEVFLQAAKAYLLERCNQLT